MSGILKMANWAARISVQHHCKSVRVVARRIYLVLGELYEWYREGEDYPWMQVPERYVNVRNFPEITNLVLEDRYYRLFRQSAFAPWQVGLNKSVSSLSLRCSYGLITDDLGFNIRQSSSYVAKKMRDMLGGWPESAKGLGRKVQDWPALLAKIGFNEEVSAQLLDNDFHYIGVNIPGEQLYWFEMIEYQRKRQKNFRIVVSTYIAGEFRCVLFFGDPKITWIKLLPKREPEH